MFGPSSQIKPFSRCFQQILSYQHLSYIYEWKELLPQRGDSALKILPTSAHLNTAIQVSGRCYANVRMSYFLRNAEWLKHIYLFIFVCKHN